MNILELIFLDNTVLEWGISLGILILILSVFYLLKSVVLRRLRAYARSTETHLDDLISEILHSTRFIFLVIIAAYFSSQYLDLPAKTSQIIASVTVIAVILQAALWGNRGIVYLLTYYNKTRKEADAISATTMSLLGFISRVVLWSVVALMLLDNLGIDITTLVASLGIGGIAVALAVQNILGDVFASLSIALDKPFVVGDFIIVDDRLGTVEHIGLKTTRIRSLSGEQIVFSNTDLLSSRIHNYKRMQERRVVFSFGVTYQTPAAKLKMIPEIVKNIIVSINETRFDRAHFKEYADSSLNFEVVYYVLSSDYNVYMDIQQKINLSLFEIFEKEAIDFAYPTQTLYLNMTESPSHPSKIGQPSEHRERPKQTDYSL